MAREFSSLIYDFQFRFIANVATLKAKPLITALIASRFQARKPTFGSCNLRILMQIISIAAGESSKSRYEK